MGAQGFDPSLPGHRSFFGIHMERRPRYHSCSRMGDTRVARRSCYNRKVSSLGISLATPLTIESKTTLNKRRYRRRGFQLRLMLAHLAPHSPQFVGRRIDYFVWTRRLSRYLRNYFRYFYHFVWYRSGKPLICGSRP